MYVPAWKSSKKNEHLGGGGQGREQEGGIEWWKQASNSQHGNAAP